jgi:TnpA family transposase
VNFGLFDLVGKALTPRIRDLGKITLLRDDAPAAICARYPHAGPLLADRWNEDLIAATWSDLLRMGGSLKFGEATASLIVGKWSAASRQNTLAAALKEWGRMRRTIHAARYLSDPMYRRKISRQLNKGESLHALRRDLHYAQQNTIVRPHLQDQTEQAWCLTLLTNAVITWTTEYYGIAIGQLRDQGRDIGDDLLSLMSPGHRGTSTSSASSTSTSKPSSPNSSRYGGRYAPPPSTSPAPPSCSSPDRSRRTPTRSPDES